MQTQKLYCYVDETGQDTLGKWFLVAVVVLEENKNEIESMLLKAEKLSGKKQVKWHKAEYKFRKIYIEKVIHELNLKNCLYFSVYKNTTLFSDMMVLTVAKAILDTATGDYSASIVIDGLKANLEKVFAVSLRRLKIKTRKVKGARDESSPLIRLADALAGLSRDAFEKNKWAEEAFRKLAKKGFIHEI